MTKRASEFPWGHVPVTLCHCGQICEHRPSPGLRFGLFVLSPSIPASLVWLLPGPLMFGVGTHNHSVEQRPDAVCG